MAHDLKKSALRPRDETPIAPPKLRVPDSLSPLAPECGAYTACTSYIVRREQDCVRVFNAHHLLRNIPEGV